MKFSIKDFFSTCEQIHSFLRIWSHLLKKSLIENFIFCAVKVLFLKPILCQCSHLFQCFPVFYGKWCALDKKMKFSIKFGLSAFKKIVLICFNESPLKIMKSAFSPLKLFSFSRYLNFLSWLFGHVEKQLDEKYKVNFKIYDITTWETNNCNARIAQYLKEHAQFLMIFEEKYFSYYILLTDQLSFSGCLYFVR